MRSRIENKEIRQDCACCTFCWRKFRLVLSDFASLIWSSTWKRKSQRVEIIWTWEQQTPWTWKQQNYNVTTLTISKAGNSRNFKAEHAKNLKTEMDFQPLCDVEASTLRRAQIITDFRCCSCSGWLLPVGSLLAAQKMGCRLTSDSAEPDFFYVTGEELMVLINFLILNSWLLFSFCFYWLLRIFDS